MTPRRAPFVLGGVETLAGRRQEVPVSIARLVTGSSVTMPVMVLHGRHDGPTVWVDAAIHGDEVCGIEIIRRVLARLDPRRMSGTLIAIPIVNVYGFMNKDRYLPDRRDLNRSFPGSPRGSLASQIAHLMMTEVVHRCDVGIDLHTGSDLRSNHPQIRADLDDPETRRLAEVFAAPVMMHAAVRDGSLRQAAHDHGARVLLYEGGEALRFDREPIEYGVAGVLRVFDDIGLTTGLGVGGAAPARESRRSRWTRATKSGILQFDTALGADVAKGQTLGKVYDSFGKRLASVRAPFDGVVIGRSEAPLVNRGDAVAHIAELADGIAGQDG